MTAIPLFGMIYNGKSIAKGMIWGVSHIFRKPPHDCNTLFNYMLHVAAPYGVMPHLAMFYSLPQKRVHKSVRFCKCLQSEVTIRRPLIFPAGMDSSWAGQTSVNRRENPSS